MFTFILHLPLLALSISSPDISEFFEIPDWCQSSVPSSETFGSPDNYVEAWSNDVADVWRTNRVLIGFKPKASRLTPQWLAATYAPFAAVCERTFYFNEGPDSSWDEETYGPTYNVKKFRFSLPRKGITPSFFYEPDTNRAVRTRRLIEFDNFRRLFSGLVWNLPMVHSLFRIERPGWDLYGYWMLGSGVFEMLPEFRELPSFAWTADPTSALSSNAWQNTAITFEHFHDNMAPIGVMMTVPGFAFDRVHFWEYPFNDEPEMVRRGLRPALRCDYRDVFTNVFAMSGFPLYKPDVVPTRRLVMDDFATASQLLSSFDVTYHNLTTSYYGETTNANAYAYGKFSFDPIELSDIAWRADYGGITAEIPNDIYLSGLSLESATYTNVMSGGMSDRACILVTPNANSHGFGSAVDEPGGVPDVTVGDLIDGIERNHPPDGTNYASVASVTFYSSGRVTFSMVDGNGTVLASVSQGLRTSLTILPSLGLTRWYEWMRTTGGSFAGHGVTHPGRRGWANSDVKLWSLTSFMTSLGNENRTVIGVEEYDDEDIDCVERYMCSFDEVSGLSAATNRMNDVLSDTMSEMRQRFPVRGYDDPASVIPIRTADVSAMCAHTRLARGSLVTAVPDARIAIAGGEAGPDGIVYVVEGGAVTSVKFVMSDGSVRDVPASFSIGNILYSCEDPQEDDGSPGLQCEDEYGASARGKFDFWTKVKWRWKALKLEF